MRLGRRAMVPAAAAVRVLFGDPISRRVLAVGLVALLGAAAVLAWLPHPRPVLDSPATGSAWLVAVLVAATCLGELTVVRLRHGEAEEELTLCEAAIIIDVLLLPAREALLTAVLGLLIASVLQRRPLVKATFNLLTYTTATSALIGVVHVVGGTPGTVTLLVVAGVLLGTGVFTAVNLFWLAQILSVISGERPWQVVRSQARLSAYMAVGTVATGLPTAVMGLGAPLLLPFMAMPALAVTFAYRAAAQESEERSRSAVLLRLSHAMAVRDDVVNQFLLLVREAFDADIATIVLDERAVVLSVDVEAPAELTEQPPAHLRHLKLADGPVVLSEGLPGDLRQVVAVPLEGGGRRFGTVGLAIRGRRRGRLSTRDLTLLAPLANTLATAMSEAEYLDRLVEETSKLQAIVEQSTEGILVVDGDDIVQMWSRALAELTAVPAAEATGRRFTGLLDLVDGDDQQPLLPVTAASPTAAVELTIRRPDGELRRLRLAHSASYAGDSLVRDVVVVSDLTREYRTERLKADFIATVSHELRTPLTPIMGYLDLLRTRADRMTPQKRQDALDLIADRARHLSRLVEDLLLASRIGDANGDVALQVSVGTHDLVAIVRQVVGDLGTTRVEVELPDHPVPVRCDSGRALQVATNLVGNALKYSPEAEPVQIRMRLDDDRVHVDVTDRGRGIPTDQLGKIFEKFHRVEDPMTMSTSGTGLGLFIARSLARAMGGDVAVTSTLNVGSVFSLSLLRSDAPVDTPAPSRASGYRIRPTPS